MVEFESKEKTTYKQRKIIARIDWCSKQEKKINPNKEKNQHFWLIKQQSDRNERKSTQPKVKLYDFEPGL